jgi:hypothetical protein
VSVLDTSITNLTAEYESLKAKLVQIDSDYRERASLVKELNRLAKALSTFLTGQPVAGASGSAGNRKPMSEAGKAAIRAGLEHARAAKQANVTQMPQTATSATSKPSSPAIAPTASQNAAAKKDAPADKPSLGRTNQ